MRLWIAFLALLTACGFQAPAIGDGGGGGGEAVPPDAQACFGTIVKVCFAVLPAAPLTLPMDNLVIDTGSLTMCNQDNDRKDDYCVLAGTNFTLAGNQSIRGSGTKPLVLVSTTTMDLQGMVDVSSNKNAPPGGLGANANSSMCTDGMAAAQGVAGAFGGSFGGKGGNGDTIGSDAGGIAATPLAALPMLLRGGCAGGTGGTGGGAGGPGGGAVAIVAGTSINLAGKVNASGSGGHGGGETKCGGGGGGSGGMIVLDAPTVTGPGMVFANGGGGGQGGTSGTGHAGDDGHESMAPTDPAGGGKNTMGGREGGPGGDGSFGTSPNGAAAPDQALANGGGGGGGGGGGFTHAPGIANIAPPSKNPT